MFQFIRIGLQDDRRNSTRAGQQRPLRRRRWRNHFLLGLERLENRTLLSTISWNNPSGGDWDTASNWSSNSVPGAGDDAVLSIAVTNPITHSLSNSDEVHSLTSQDPINISGGTLTIDAASTVNNTLTLAGGTLTGARRPDRHHRVRLDRRHSGRHRQPHPGPERPDEPDRRQQHDDRRQPTR